MCHVGTVPIFSKNPSFPCVMIPIIIYLPEQNHFDTAQQILTEAGFISGQDLLLLGPGVNIGDVTLLLTPGKTELFVGMEYLGEAGQIMTSILFQKILLVNPQAILVGCSSQQGAPMQGRYKIHHEARLSKDGEVGNNVSFAHTLPYIIQQFNTGNLVR